MQLGLVGCSGARGNGHSVEYYSTPPPDPLAAIYPYKGVDGSTDLDFEYQEKPSLYSIPVNGHLYYPKAGAIRNGLLP